MSDQLAPTELGLPRLRFALPHQAKGDALDTLSLLALLVASSQATSKASLVEVTGLARSTVSGHVDTLLAHGILQTHGSKAIGGRGRPANRLAISPKAGLVMAVDMGAHISRCALATLDQRLLAGAELRLDVASGPGPVMAALKETLAELVLGPGRGYVIRFAAIGVPARVDMRTGLPVRPNLMPGWDAHPVRSEISDHFGCPAAVENDSNLRAIAEAAVLPEDQCPMVAIKVATGVGAGIIDSDGRVFHGYDGGAGDIGHVPVPGAPPIRCSCGSTGCLETVVSLPAVAHGLQESHPELFQASQSPEDQMVHLLQASNRHAIAQVRAASEALGQAVATVCNTLNPRRVVLGGELAAASDEVLATTRAVAYRHARPLANRNVEITNSTLGLQAGLAGAIVLAVQGALSPDNLASWIRTTPPRRFT